MNDVPMQTVCVGRMLVDLPKGKQTWQQEFDHAEVSKLPASVNSKKAFEAYANKRKADLEKHTHYNPEGRVYNYKQVGDRAVIIQYEGKGSDKVSYTDRFLWLGDWGYKYETGALFKEEAANLLPIMEKHFEHVLPIQNTDPPDKSGFCIDSALVTGETGPISADVSAHVKQWQDVVIGVGTAVDDGSRKPLPWQRSTAEGGQAPTAFDVLKMKQEAADARRHADEANRVVSFDVLRKREKSIADTNGQEAAYRQELANGQEYYDFNWVATNVDANSDHLALAISLRAGRSQYNSSYKAPPSEEELLALWDAVLESVEFRTSSH